MSDFLLFLVRWVFVPLLLKMGFYLSWLIIRNTQHDEAKISGVAGAIAGVVVGAACLAFQFWSLDASASLASAFQLNTLALCIAATVGVIVGAIVPLITLWVERTILAGLVTVIFSASSAVASVNYYFNVPARGTVLIIALAVFFGALFHFILSPGTYKKIAAAVSYTWFPDFSSQPSSGAGSATRRAY